MVTGKANKFFAENKLKIIILEKETLIYSTIQISKFTSLYTSYYVYIYNRIIKNQKHYFFKYFLFIWQHFNNIKKTCIFIINYKSKVNNYQYYLKKLELFIIN